MNEILKQVMPRTILHCDGFTFNLDLQCLIKCPLTLAARTKVVPECKVCQRGKQLRSFFSLLSFSIESDRGIQWEDPFYNTDFINRPCTEHM